MMSITAEPSRRLHRQRSRVESHASFSHGTVPHLVALADFAIVLASSVVGVVGYHFAAFGLFADPAQNVGIGLLTATLFVLAMSCLRAYGYHELLSVRHQSMLIALLVPGVLAFLLTVLFFLKLGDTFSRGAVLTLAGMSVGGLIGARLFWRRHLRRAVAGGRLRLKNTCFICPEAMAGEDLERIARGGGMRIAQVARLDGASPLPALVRRASATGAGAIEEVVIVWRDDPVSGLEALLDDLRMLPLPVKVIFDNFTGAVVSCQAESLGGVSAFQVQSPPLVWVERTAKRLFDIMFALSALLLLAPMLVVVALAIKLDSPGPVFFAQRRLGHASKPFRILKFRSM
ncbi:MAG: polyprenyl glycosylphosphotransferase, partial [Mesorhizobium amorphae]